MKNFKFILVMALALVIGVTSCQKEDVDSESTSEIYFKASFPDASSYKKTDGYIDGVTEPIPVNCEEVLELITYAYIEVGMDDNTSTIFQVEAFVTEGTVNRVVTKDPLTLPAGDYTIKSFYLTDVEGGLPLLAIPTTSSIYSTFVSSPLEQSFSVDGVNRKDYLDLEVLCINAENEPNFGLAYFDLDIITTMPICVLGNICDEDGMHSEAAFTMTVYDFTGDYSTPRGDMVITSHNFDTDAGGFLNPDGSLTEEPEDALLCTYLPDRTDDDNQEFWIDIQVYDPTSPWADETTGLYLVESGYLSESEIKAKFTNEVVPEDGVIPVNWFHFQINHSNDCSDGERFLTNDGCEESFYFSSYNANVNGLFKYVQDGQAMFVWSNLLDDTQLTQSNFDIAYNSYNNVLYVIDGDEFYTFQNDVLVEKSGLYPYIFDNDVTKITEITQAVYADHKLYLGNVGGSEGSEILVIDLNDNGLPNKIYDNTAVQQRISVSPEFGGGDLIVNKVGEQSYLKQINSWDTINTWELDVNGSIIESTLVSTEGAGRTTGAMVFDGKVYVTEEGVGIIPLFGTSADALALPNFTQASDYNWSDLASCSTTVN